MKSQRYFAVTAIFGIVAALATVSGARSGKSQLEAASVKARSLSGSWAFTINQDDGEVYPFHITFDEGGGLIASCDSPLITPLHGNWMAVGNHQIALTFVGQAFDGSGNDAGTFKGRMNLTLSDAGDALTGALKFDAFDTAGNFIPALSSTGVTDGNPIRIESL